MLLPFEDVLFLLAMPADASPSPDQTGLSKHCLPDFHGVIARHVLCRIRAFDIEVVGLYNHAAMIAKQYRNVQRHI